jgi:hypothetical protein
LALLLAGAELGLASCGGAHAARIDGTFIQLHAEHANWTANDWQVLFGRFQTLGLRELVVQWTVHDDRAFYPSPSSPSASSHVLETLLRSADASGMEVWIGLFSDSAYWNNVTGEPTAVSAYLDQIRAKSVQTATELREQVTWHPAFQIGRAHV